MTAPDFRVRGPADRLAARVLVIDDERMVRQELAALLDEEALPVVGQARDGADGVAMAGAVGPDVVLMDLRVPLMSGIEATRRVKDRLPRTQVIMLSAYEDAGLKRSARDVGAYACLVKGCGAEKIIETVEAARRLKHRLEGQEAGP